MIPDKYARQRRYRERKRAIGLCYTCAQPALPGRRYCELHQQMKRDDNSARRHRLTAQGLCYYCGTPLEPEAIAAGRKTHPRFDCSKRRRSVR